VSVRIGASSRSGSSTLQHGTCDVCECLGSTP
jgi:hypothetical protein